MRKPALIVFLTAAILTPPASATIQPLADKVTVVVADRQDSQTPDAMQLTGWLGSRIAASEANRLVKMDTDRLLEGYRHRPGRQAWDGEHIGKWLHAATLAWVYTGDPALRRKLDATVSELMHRQLADGYLGTYTPGKRWTEWDVWSHKYNLIGLLTYIRYTGDTTPLDTCRRMADLLCREIGDGPGQRDILTAGSQHYGMASTSVLEPMVLLYRLTGETRYLDFCRYIIRAWEKPNGPHIVSHLLAGDGVNQVGNGKGYEMLSCLNGALEYYRTTGERPLFDAVGRAWEDIVAHRLYPTGAATAGELFHADNILPDMRDVGETCVTVTWLQVNAQLLRLTGDARYAEQLERVVTNQLFGAQRPDGTGWGYYVQMAGKKNYTSTLDGQCCLSSGPRGVALIPTFALSTDDTGVVVNLYDAGTAHLVLRNGNTVTIRTETLYPADGQIRMAIEPANRSAFGIGLRIPAWCRRYSLQVNGQKVSPPPSNDGYVRIIRTWAQGDRIDLNLTLEPRVISGDHGEKGRVAVLYGPLVLAADTALLEGQGGIDAIALSGADPAGWHLAPEPAPAALNLWSGTQVFRLGGVIRKTGGPDLPISLRLIPYADAGCGDTTFRVWLPLAQTDTSNVLREGQEKKSGPWGRTRYDGSINDGDVATISDTFGNQPAKEAWFEVRLLEPHSIHRVVFRHGCSDPDGGWFAADSGKPRVQVQETPGGNWETVGELADYPAATVTQPTGLSDGAGFECVLASPRQAIAVRVIGQPASGNNSGQAFATCAELEAF